MLTDSSRKFLQWTLTLMKKTLCEKRAWKKRIGALKKWSEKRGDARAKTCCASGFTTDGTTRRACERSRVWWAKEDVSPQNVFRSEKNLCFLLDSTLVALGVDEAEACFRLEDDGVRAERDMEYAYVFQTFNLTFGYSLANFVRLVLGCSEAKFCKSIFV